MFRLPKRLPAAGQRTDSIRRPAARACPACGGTQTRLVRKTIRHPSRGSEEAHLCSSCCHFWLETQERQAAAV